MEKIGQLLFKFRQEKNLTIRALASALGISNSYITKLEKGTRLPSAELFLKLSKYFGLHPLNLLEKCNNIPKSLEKEIKLKTLGEAEYELRMRAAWEVEDPELKKLNLPFNDLLKYVQQKAKSNYYSQQIYRQQDKKIKEERKIKPEVKKYKNINRPKIIKSSCSKRKQNSHQGKDKQIDSGGKAKSDDGEPPIDYNFKIYKLKAKV